MTNMNLQRLDIWHWVQSIHNCSRERIHSYNSNCSSCLWPKCCYHCSHHEHRVHLKWCSACQLSHSEGMLLLSEKKNEVTIMSFNELDVQPLLRGNEPTEEPRPVTNQKIKLTPTIDNAILWRGGKSNLKARKIFEQDRLNTKVSCEIKV